VRVMSQVYQSEEDRFEGRERDSKVGKSCILESHVWTRIDRALKSRNLYLFSWIVLCSKKSRPCGQSCFLMYVCSFQIISSVSYDIIQLQIVCHSHSIIVEMSLPWENLTYEILSLRKRESPDLVAKCKGVLWSKSLKSTSTGHITWYWELDV